MAKPKGNPPPETEVLASGNLSPEEAKELAEKAKASPVVETPVEDAGIKLKPISEQILVGPPPKEVSSSPNETEKVKTEDVTHDPLKDTQRKMHEEIEKRKVLEGELSKMKTLVEGVITEKQLQDRVAPTQEPEMPPEFFDLTPTDGEFEDPTKYTQRMMRVQEIKIARESKQKEIQDFARDNPDYKEWVPQMTAISDRMPGLKYGPNTLSNLLELAQKDKQIEDMKKTLKEAEETGLAAGAKLEKNKTEVFIKPGAASPRASVTVPDFENGINPATNLPWTSDDMTQWAKEHNLYRES